MDTQTQDGLEKVTPLKYGPLLVSMLDFWGPTSSNGGFRSQRGQGTRQGTATAKKEVKNLVHFESKAL